MQTLKVNAQIVDAGTINACGTSFAPYLDYTLDGRQDTHYSRNPIGYPC